MERTHGRAALKWEAALYWCVVALHLVPVLSSKWFVTLDGPCHLYNARIIADLLRGSTSAATFFHINPFPEPNWLGHAIMAFTMFFAPAWIAEKLVFTLAIIGLAWSFRAFIRTIAPERVWMSWLVMPFLLSYTLRMGFINFSLSLPLLFVALGSWNVLRGDPRSRNRWRLAAAMLLLYFAHLSTFLLCTGTLALWAVRESVAPSNLRRAASSLKQLIACTAMPLSLVVWYHFAHPAGPAAPKFLPKGELLQWIFDGRAWNTLVYAQELRFTRTMAVVMLAMFVVAVIVALRDHRWRKPDALLIWAGVALILFTAYFLLPDEMAGGKIASPRLLLFAMMFIAIVIAFSRLHRVVAVCGIVIIVVADGAHTLQQTRTAESLGQEADELVSIASSVPEGAVLLPLNYGDNQMHSNMSNYIGAMRHAIVLDNFAAYAAHDPILWNRRMGITHIGNFATSNRPCVRINAYVPSAGIRAGQVLTWKMNDTMDDSCANDLRAQLAAHYHLVATSPHGDARLYQLNDR